MTNLTRYKLAREIVHLRTAEVNSPLVSICIQSHFRKSKPIPWINARNWPRAVRLFLVFWFFVTSQILGDPLHQRATSLAIPSRKWPQISRLQFRRCPPMFWIRLTVGWLENWFVGFLLSNAFWYDQWLYLVLAFWYIAKPEYLKTLVVAQQFYPKNA